MGVLPGLGKRLFILGNRRVRFLLQLLCFRQIVSNTIVPLFQNGGDARQRKFRHQVIEQART